MFSIVKVDRAHVVSRKYNPAQLTDGDPGTFWASGVNEPVSLEIDLGEKQTFDHIVLQEPIRFGQRISAFHIEIPDGMDHWKTLAEATTIGYKRILVTEPVTTRRLRIVVDRATDPPALSQLGLYYKQ